MVCNLDFNDRSHCASLTLGRVTAGHTLFFLSTGYEVSQTTVSRKLLTNYLARARRQFFFFARKARHKAANGGKSFQCRTDVKSISTLAMESESKHITSDSLPLRKETWENPALKNENLKVLIYLILHISFSVDRDLTHGKIKTIHESDVKAYENLEKL